MVCIQNDNMDCYFNLAAEEYLFKNYEDDVFMLWKNTPSIIIGKHQNAFAEVNMDFVRKNRIKLARRLSGGGTVYQDEGNLNFTFIKQGREGKQVDFKKYTGPVRSFLESLGLETKFEGHNSITCKGEKISGNAEHVYKNRVMHHGTLLFSSDLTILGKAIEVQPGVYTDKAVKSVRSKVTNISEHLEEQMDIQLFADRFMNFIMEHAPGSKRRHFSKGEVQKIKNLSENKYKTEEWIYGYSPKYEFRKTSSFSDGSLRIHLKVEKGSIHYIHITGDRLPAGDLSMIETGLRGQPHLPHIIKAIMSQVQSDISPDDDALLMAFF